MLLSSRYGVQRIPVSRLAIRQILYASDLKMSLDLAALKLKPKAEGIVKTAPLLKTLRVGRPDNTTFFRIRSGDEWVAEYPIYTSKTSKDKYLVMPEFQSELEERNSLVPSRFFFGVEWGTGVLFLTDVGIKVNDEGNFNSYNKSRLELYEIAETKWISISANMDLGAYTATEAKSKIPDPEWPVKPANIDEAIELAFKDNVIASADHPVLKRLRGEI